MIGLYVAHCRCGLRLRPVVSRTDTLRTLRRFDDRRTTQSWLEFGVEATGEDVSGVAIGIVGGVLDEPMVGGECRPFVQARA